MEEPAYSFTISSLNDGTTLDCRIYHPKKFAAACLSHPRGAVIAHPYAPLGGSQNDAVVLEVAHCLLGQGFIVGSFNFRGAGDSQGKTSWTGKGEKDDYASFAGFLVHYLQDLREGHCAQNQTPYDVELLLAGYSYGSLILSHLPPLSVMMRPFRTADTGTAAASIILRARILASDSFKKFEAAIPVSPRGRQVPRGDARSSSADMGPAKASTVSIGGEETNPKRRLDRESRDGRRGLDVVRRSFEVPHRIKAHIRHRSSSGSRSQDKVADADSQVPDHNPPYDVRVRYLLVSPLLPPLASVLVSHHSLSSWFGRRDESNAATSGFVSVTCPSLVVWGTHDMFTSHKRLNEWAEKLERNAPGLLTYAEIDNAGHFWREQGSMKQLLQQIKDWVMVEQK